MHLNQGNWERAGREEDEISFWLLLENLLSKASRLLGMEDAECWKYKGLSDQSCGLGDGCVWLQHVLLSFPSNCVTVFPLHLVKLLAVFDQNHFSGSSCVSGRALRILSRVF